MHRITAALLASLPLVLLAGCTATAPAPVQRSTAPGTPTPSVTAAVAALRMPPRTKDEILRSTVTASSVHEVVADSHGVRQATVRVACAGATGSNLGWTLEDGHGRLLVGSTADCTGTVEGADWTDPGPSPDGLQIALVPHGDLSSGYAVLSRH
jgi:hypothetical protein